MRALLGVLALWTGAPATSVLSWDAPLSGCPTPEEIGQRLAARLGARTLEVEASARVRPAGAALRLDLRVRWRDRVDEHTLEADTCESLAEAAVVLVALMAEAPRELGEAPTPSAEAAVVPAQAVVDEAGRSQETVVTPPDAPVTDEAEGSAETSAVPAAPLAAPAPGTQSARIRHARGFSVALAGLVDVGSLDAVSGGLRGTLGWRWPRARVFVSGTYVPPRGVASAAVSAAHGRVQLGFVQLGACVRLGPPRVEVPLCAALEAGGSRGTGFGVGANLGARDPWVAFAAAPAVVVPLSRVLALIVQVEAAVPLIRSRYIYGDEAVLLETAPVAVRGGLGLEVRFGNQFSREPENR